MHQEVSIREAAENDLEAVLAVEKEAFDRDDEGKLVEQLLLDPTAKPLLSLIAFSGDNAIGHILFTKVSLLDAPRAISANILAPLAVVPNAQRQGIGGRLINEGLRRLTKTGIDLVFVLGYPKYYVRHGFKPAGCLGFTAPYPIPEKDADAWMVQPLREGVIDAISGKVVCAKSLDRPEYWRE